MAAVIIFYYEKRGNISSRFSSNSEASASELIEINRNVLQA